MTTLFTLPQLQVFDTSGDPLPGARLYFYETGTSSAKVVYQDSDATSSHTQPVVADSSGVFQPIWLDMSGGAYRAVLKDAGDVTQWTVDDVGWTENSNLPAGVFDMRAYGLSTSASAATNDTAFVNAIAAAVSIGGGILQIPSGAYSISSSIELYDNVIIRGCGIEATLLKYYGSAEGIKNATPSTRIYACGIESLTIRDYGTGTIGIDLDSVSTTHVRDVLVHSFDTAVRCYSPTGLSGYSVYNRFYNVTAGSCTTGFRIQGSATSSCNAHVYDACRFNGATTSGTVGWWISDGNGNQIVNSHIDVAGIAIKLTSNASGTTDGNFFAGNRIEGVTTGFSLGSSVRHTKIGGTFYSATGTEVTDSGTNTVRFEQTIYGIWPINCNVTVNGTKLLVDNAAPILGISESDQGTDEKNWAFLGSGATISLRAYDDAWSDNKAALSVGRTASAVTAVNFGNAYDNPSYAFFGTGTITASGPLTVTGNVFRLNGASPIHILNETDQGTDEKHWYLTASGKKLLLRTSDEAISANRDILTVDRGTGIATTGITLGNSTDNPTLTVAGTGLVSMDHAKLRGAAVAASTGEVALGNGTQATVGSAGAAAAVPASAAGYLKIYIGSTQYVIPYFAAS